jgi:hypothetical protein
MSVTHNRKRSYPGQSCGGEESWGAVDIPILSAHNCEVDSRVSNQLRFRDSDGALGDISVRGYTFSSRLPEGAVSPFWKWLA